LYTEGRKKAHPNLQGTGPPETRGRPGQANSFASLQTDILKTLTTYDRAGESFWERVAKLRIIFREIITRLENSLLTPFNMFHIRALID
jgi:hypothetical protein